MIYKFLISILLMFLVVGYTSLFIVQEGQRGIILRFNKISRDKNNSPIVYNPGLHIKIPIIESVKYLDARIQTMENQADRFVTMEKKDLIIDSYIKWKISDFSRYYLATGGGDVSQAEGLLKRKFSDRLRSELGKLNVRGIVTDFRNRLMTDVKQSLNNGVEKTTDKEKYLSSKNSDFIFSKINEENNVMHMEVNSNSMKALGIEVIDVRIKQINLPTEVSYAIYQRMRAEREAVARRHRSQGQEEAEKIRATADYQVMRILAEAERRSFITRGEADTETTKLYAKAFNNDPLFYMFIRSLRAYENSFSSKNDIMILGSENNFFRFMKYSENIFTKK